MSNILVIIPLHKLEKEDESLFKDSIESVPENIDIVVSVAKDIADKVTDFTKKYKNVKVKANESDDTDFVTLVENGIDDNYEWFSILEFDDEYTPIWFDNVAKYIEFKPETSVFLPLDDIVDYKKNEYIGYGNEAAWASSFSNELGYIDLDCLQNFFQFYLTGGVFNTKDWKEIGGLKGNIKIYYWYEFLLRLTNKGKKVYVLPKVGYVHYLGRDGSIVDSYSKGLTEQEADYWRSVAKKEYFFTTPREIAPYTGNKDED